MTPNPTIEALRAQYTPGGRPMPVSYRGYLVTGIVPENASATDDAFVKWSERADAYIALASERGWSKQEIEAGLLDVVKYPALA